MNKIEGLEFIERIYLMEDGFGNKHVELVLLNEDISLFVFCFDKEGLLDVLDYCSNCISEGHLNRFIDFAKGCILPDSCDTQPIPISGHLAYKTVRYLTALRSAAAQSKAWSYGLTEVNLVITSYFLSYVSQGSDSTDHPGGNCLLIIPRDFYGEFSTFVINSKEQLAAVITDEQISLSDADIANITSNLRKMVLPESSDVPVLSIMGDIGNYIAIGYLYGVFIEEQISGFGSCEWKKNANLN